MLGIQYVIQHELLASHCQKFISFYLPTIKIFLTLVLLNPDISCFANSVDSDQLASEEANWSESALFAIKYVNLL